MRNKLAALLLLCGAALMLSALALHGHNRQEDSQAGKASAESLSQLLLQIETKQEAPGEEETKPLTPEECVMKETILDGNAYVGYLSIPELELELPVISQWTYDALQVAPCRYTGTMKGEDLVLLAHNYDQHFGKLSKLQEDAEVTFTDMEGTTYRYRVALQETLDGADVEGMTAGEYPLSLFTCTRDSQSRIVIRCQRKKQ